MRTAEWKDYTVIATSNGYKLEDWGGVKLLRPDPQVIWKSDVDMDNYKGLAAKYIRSETGGGRWLIKAKCQLNGRLVIKTLSSKSSRWALSIRD